MPGCQCVALIGERGLGGKERAAHRQIDGEGRSANGRSHRVVAAVDVHDLSGDRACEVGEQESDGVGDWAGVLGVPPQRRDALTTRGELDESSDDLTTASEAPMFSRQRIISVLAQRGTFVAAREQYGEISRDEWKRSETRVNDSKEICFLYQRSRTDRSCCECSRRKSAFCVWE
jgi:hypothetical protein